MRKLLRALAILGSLAVAAVSQAAVGTVNITWDNCSGPVDKTTTATGVYSLFLTVIGHDQPQRAYDVRVVYGNASQTVPDAWRFDADGCQASVGIRQDITSRACPPFSTHSTTAIRRSCAAMPSALRPFAPAGSAAIRRASAPSTGC